MTSYPALEEMDLLGSDRTADLSTLQRCRALSLIISHIVFVSRFASGQIVYGNLIKVYESRWSWTGSHKNLQALSFVGQVSVVSSEIHDLSLV